MDETARGQNGPGGDQRPLPSLEPADVPIEVTAAAAEASHVVPEQHQQAGKDDSADASLAESARNDGANVGSVAVTGDAIAIRSAASSPDAGDRRPVDASEASHLPVETSLQEDAPVADIPNDDGGVGRPDSITNSVLDDVQQPVSHEAAKQVEDAVKSPKITTEDRSDDLENKAAISADDVLPLSDPQQPALQAASVQAPAEDRPADVQADGVGNAGNGYEMVDVELRQSLDPTTTKQVEMPTEAQAVAVEDAADKRLDEDVVFGEERHSLQDSARDGVKVDDVATENVASALGGDIASRSEVHKANTATSDKGAVHEDKAADVRPSDTSIDPSISANVSHNKEGSRDGAMGLPDAHENEHELVADEGGSARDPLGSMPTESQSQLPSPNDQINEQVDGAAEQITSAAIATTGEIEQISSGPAEDSAAVSTSDKDKDFVMEPSESAGVPQTTASSTGQEKAQDADAKLPSDLPSSNDEQAPTNEQGPNVTSLGDESSAITSSDERDPAAARTTEGEAAPTSQSSDAPTSESLTAAPAKPDAATSADAAAANPTSASVESRAPSASEHSRLHTIKPASDPQADLLLARRIALLLKINKELIRLCVSMQEKNLATDPIFKDAAVRLQANLAFLASHAEPHKKHDGHANIKLIDAPFKETSHAPDSLLPRLYDHLRSLETDSMTEKTSGKKRQREDSREGDGAANLSNVSDASPAASIADGDFKRPTTPASAQAARSSSPALSAASSAKAQSARRKSIISTSSPISRAAGSSDTAAPTATAAGARPNKSSPNSKNNQGVQSLGGKGPLHAVSASAPSAAIPNAPTPGPSQGPSNGPAASSGPSPQQIQNLVQTFGQNAVANLNALQSHYRHNQPQQVVSFMENNVPNFRSLPIQVQMQHMTNAQNAAMQRQRVGSSGSAGSPAPQSQSTSRRPSSVQPNARNTASPMAAPATPVMAAGHRPNTPASAGGAAGSMPPGSMGSPAAPPQSPGPGFRGTPQQRVSSEGPGVPMTPQQTNHQQSQAASFGQQMHMPPHLRQGQAGTIGQFPAHQSPSQQQSQQQQSYEAQQQQRGTVARPQQLQNTFQQQQQPFQQQLPQQQQAHQQQMPGGPGKNMQMDIAAQFPMLAGMPPNVQQQLLQQLLLQQQQQQMRQQQQQQQQNHQMPQQQQMSSMPQQQQQQQQIQQAMGMSGMNSMMQFFGGGGHQPQQQQQQQQQQFQGMPGAGQGDVSMPSYGGMNNLQLGNNAGNYNAAANSQNALHGNNNTSGFPSSIWGGQQ